MLAYTVRLMAASTLLTTGIGFAQSNNRLSILPPLSGNGYLRLMTENLYKYQLQLSTNLESWTNFGPIIVGTGATVGVTYQANASKMFYKLREFPVRPGFNAHVVFGNDDESAGGEEAAPDPIPIGFSVKFGEEVPYSTCYVNNNWNITFGAAFEDFSIHPFTEKDAKIIAPLWSDVETRWIPVGQATKVAYNTGTVDGRAAFGVTWEEVGYYYNKYDKLNTFQVILIQRNDLPAGDFDVEFNYNKIQWETGQSSFSVGGIGGSPTSGLGGAPARAGISARRAGKSEFVELPYSGDTLAQLDNVETGLIYRSRSSLPGRYRLEGRSGFALGALSVNAESDQTWHSTAPKTLSGSSATAGATVRWSVYSGYPDVGFSNPNILNPIITMPVGKEAVLKLTATTAANKGVEATDLVYVFRF